MANTSHLSSDLVAFVIEQLNEWTTGTSLVELALSAFHGPGLQRILSSDSFNTEHHCYPRVMGFIGLNKRTVILTVFL